MHASAELLAWYDRHRRDLPWRRTDDPFRIWLSEVMLQQTRVETVLPYFERFLERFPTVETLAEAPVEEVLALWSGLGYYRRARQLHSAAQAVARNGGFPDTLEGLRQLPGVGEYTAAAVGSIAFGIAEPVLDGNVERVLCRYLALEGDPKRRAVRQLLRATGEGLLNPARPGDSNQALMELGATVCTPKRPRCLLCPLRSDCQAMSDGQPERFPTPREKRAGEEYRLLAALVEERGRTLLFRRPEGSSLLAGIWEVPWALRESPSGVEKAPAEQILAARYGGEWRLGTKVGAVKHGITFRDLEVEVVHAEVAGGDEVRNAVEAGWFDEEGRRRLPLSSLVGKILSVARTGPPARKSRSRRR